ncbi:unnamed protein product [Cyclocybe aegerita]|uniref:Uncharacterized protein n=1 Tax=Cyclocybe aegerita TaxID=1973307 RepID=A0A8S0VUN4_CYCAE|nr:unnamed protein product [Cyclocybe aegerita]
MDATTGDLPPLVNPFTPNAFLPPVLAYQNTMSNYVYVGTLSVLVWDILTHVRQDSRFIFRCPVRLPSLIYLFSRLISLALVLTVVIFQTAPVAIPCRTLDTIAESFFAVSVALTSLLFLFRVRAIFDRNKYVRAFFSLMWLAVVAAVITPTQGLTGMNIGPTKYCIHEKVEMYVGAANLLPLVNDTLIFLAISWKLMQNTHAASAHPLSGKINLRAFLRGDYLPAFSRGLLQDGQVYYLTTITTNLMTVIVFYLTSAPTVYRAMFGIPNEALMNMMACRVYRRTKLAHYKELKKPSSNPSTSKPNDGAPILPLAFAPNRNNSNLKQLEDIERKYHPFEVIELVKNVESRGGQLDPREEVKMLKGYASTTV